MCAAELSEDFNNICVPGAAELGLISQGPDVVCTSPILTQACTVLPILAKGGQKLASISNNMLKVTYTFKGKCFFRKFAMDD